MLEKPSIADGRIADCLRDAYDLRAPRVNFLPLGADRNTAVYRVTSDGAAACFVKLRRGPFDDAAVAVPSFLHALGIAPVMAPLPSRSQQLWTPLDDFTVVVYPYVDGCDGYALALSERQWIELGRALNGIHAARVPPELAARIARETYSGPWRALATAFQARAACETFGEPVSARLAALLRAKRDVINGLIGQAAYLAAILRSGSTSFVLCHADLHAGNLLIEPAGALHIVDWDAPVLAPKERDLMFIGGGLLGGWRSAPDEEALFLRGYGPSLINPIALAYYRCERIVQDIAAYCEEIFLTDPANRDREVGLRQLTSQFEADDVVAHAQRAVRMLPPAHRRWTP